VVSAYGEGRMPRGTGLVGVSEGAMLSIMAWRDDNGCRRTMMSDRASGTRVLRRLVIAAVGIALDALAEELRAIASPSLGT